MKRARVTLEYWLTLSGKQLKGDRRTAQYVTSTCIGSHLSARHHVSLLSPSHPPLPATRISCHLSVEWWSNIIVTCTLIPFIWTHVTWQSAVNILLMFSTRKSIFNPVSYSIQRCSWNDAVMNAWTGRTLIYFYTPQAKDLFIHSHSIHCTWKWKTWWKQLFKQTTNGFICETLGSNTLTCTVSITQSTNEPSTHTDTLVSVDNTHSKYIGYSKAQLLTL